MPRASVRTDRQAKLDRLFTRAYKQQEAGNLLSAFRLFLAAAKGGDSGCQLNLGNFYSDGIGIKPNRELGLYWYRRALRHNERAAANNIAIVFQNEGKIDLALKWFERAIKSGDYDANVRVAKIYLDRNERGAGNLACSRLSRRLLSVWKHPEKAGWKPGCGQDWLPHFPILRSAIPRRTSVVISSL